MGPNNGLRRNDQSQNFNIFVVGLAIILGSCSSQDLQSTPWEVGRCVVNSESFEATEERLTIRASDVADCLTYDIQVEFSESHTVDLQVCNRCESEVTLSFVGPPGESSSESGGDGISGGYSFVDRFARRTPTRCLIPSASEIFRYPLQWDVKTVALAGGETRKWSWASDSTQLFKDRFPYSVAENTYADDPIDFRELQYIEFLLPRQSEVVSIPRSSCFEAGHPDWEAAYVGLVERPNLEVADPHTIRVKMSFEDLPPSLREKIWLNSQRASNLQ